VQDFGTQLPSRVISELIGVDPADREEIRQTIDLTFHLDPEKGMINDVSLTAQIKLHEYYSQQIESRRRAPRGDMMIAPAGSKVLLLTGSAGRDYRKYAHADRYDVRSSFDGHVAFGRGPHFCLGASLVRLEGRVALEETLARFPEWDVDHDRAVRLHTSTVRGYERLPITV
jgi:cytochrome P450